MENSHQSEKPAVSRRDLVTTGLGLRDINPQILDNPNYQLDNPNIPIIVKKQEKQKRIAAEDKKSRRTLITTISTGVALIAAKLGWPPINERLKQEADYRKNLKNRNEQLADKKDLVNPSEIKPSKPK